MNTFRANGNAWSPAYKQFRFAMQWIDASRRSHDVHAKARLAARETGLPIETVTTWVAHMERERAA